MTSATPVRRVGIVGAGQIVENAHLPVLESLASTYVSWIVDANPSRAQRVHRMFRVPCLPIESLSAQLRTVDVCLIAVPLGARADYLKACAESGVAVYCEKPFARSPAQHETMCRPFAPERIAAGFQRRYHAGIRTVAAAVESGELGDLREVRLFAGTFDLRSGGADRFTGNARLAGGGMIIESRIHELDQIVFATQASDVRTQSARGILFDGIDYHCETRGQLVCGSRSVPVSCLMTKLGNVRERLEFSFESGTVTLGLAADSVPHLKGRPLDLAPGYATRVVDGFRIFWENFLRGLDDHFPNDTSACRSMATTQWIADIYHAMQTRAAAETPAGAA